MIKFGFGKSIKPRRFDYAPRYYDEVKDELQERLGKYKGNVQEEDKIKRRIKAGLRQKYNGDNTYRSQEVKKSNVRLLLVFLFLVAISYLLLKSNKISRLIESLG
jgi:hypothetical protein